MNVHYTKGPVTLVIVTLITVCYTELIFCKVYIQCFLCFLNKVHNAVNSEALSYPFFVQVFGISPFLFVSF